MKARINYIVVVFTINLLLLVQCGIDSNTVATVGDLEITVNEFKNILKNRYPNETDLTKIELEKKKELLDQTIQKKLKINAALDNDLDKDIEIVEQVKKQEENLLGQKFFEVEIVDKLISQEEIDEFIQRQGIELKVSYIVIGYDKSRISKERTKNEATEIAKKVLSEAKKGGDFSDLVVQYSDDPSAKRNKGDSGYFRWGQKPKAFQEACWNLDIGEISDIVETQMGFNIFQLVDRREDENYVPQNDPETVLRIKKTLYSAVADSGTKLWEEKVKEIKEENSYQYYDSEVNKITQLLNDKIVNTKVDINSFTDEEKNIVLAEWDSDKIEFEKILKRYENNLPRVLGALRDPNKMKREIQNLSLLSIALFEARKIGIHEDEQIVKTITRFKEDRLSYLAEKKLVNDKVTFSDEDVKKYYETNPDQFMDPAKLEMWAINVKDEALAGKISKMAKRGSNFESLAKKYSTDKYYKEKGGYLGFRTINSRGSISKKAFDMEPNGKISDPIKYKKDWAIVKTGELKDKRLRPFQDVAKMVEGRLKNNLLKNMRDKWKNELNEMYTVKINDEVLNSL